MAPHEIVAWTGAAIVVGLVVGPLVLSSAWAARVWVWGTVTLPARWRAWRLRRGLLPINGLRPGENRFARLRDVVKR